MKYISLSVLLLTTLILSSCNKKDDVIGGDNNRTASISVRVATSGATEAGTPAEQKINNLIVLVYMAGVQEAYGFAEFPTNGNLEVDNLKVRMGPKSIVAIANASSQLKEELKGMSLAELKKKTATLTDIATPNNLLMVSDIRSVDVNKTKAVIGGSKAGYEVIDSNPLKLQRVCAKVQITNLSLNFGPEITSRFDIVPFRYGLVFMPGISPLIATTPMKSIDIRSWCYSDNLFSSIPADLKAYSDFELPVETSYDGYGSAGFGKGPSFDSFYITRNESETSPTILVIVAKIRKSDKYSSISKEDRKELMDAGILSKNADLDADYNDKDIMYFPIRINHFDEISGYNGQANGPVDVISPNTFYKLNITLSKFGVSSPYKDIKSGTLDVQCTVENWTEVNQSIPW